jgi:hypothetical protein
MTITLFDSAAAVKPATRFAAGLATPTRKARPVVSAADRAEWAATSNVHAADYTVSATPRDYDMLAAEDAAVAAHERGLVFA